VNELGYKEFNLLQKKSSNMKNILKQLKWKSIPFDRKNIAKKLN